MAFLVGASRRPSGDRANLLRSGEMGFRPRGPRKLCPQDFAFEQVSVCVLSVSNFCYACRRIFTCVNGADAGMVFRADAGPGSREEAFASAAEIRAGALSRNFSATRRPELVVCSASRPHPQCRPDCSSCGRSIGAICSWSICELFDVFPDRHGCSAKAVLAVNSVRRRNVRSGLALGGGVVSLFGPRDCKSWIV